MFIAIKGVTKVFHTTPPKVALRDVEFSIEKGDFVIITGENGSGKSVLMSIIAGLQKPTKGSVEFSPKDTKVALIFQDADTQILGETVREDIAFSVRNAGFRGSALDGKVLEAAKAVGLEEKLDESARALSGGDKRRLAVASGIALGAALIIFDEPFANLDEAGVKSVSEVLVNLKKEGKTLIVLTHTIEQIVSLGTKFVRLQEGKVVFLA